MQFALPSSWKAVIGEELDQPYFRRLQEFVEEERQKYTVYPARDEVYAALNFTPFHRVSVCLLGQDPYHDANQAHGLAFSVRSGVRPPPSLVNIFKELKEDLGCHLPNNGCLVPWAEQGVLLLNAVLTVRAHQPNSHKGKGWEQFTDAVLRKLNEKRDPVLFLFWGGHARKKASLIDTGRHTIIESAHPSPLSANSGFFGSRPFSAVNRALRAAGKPEINWQIPDIESAAHAKPR